MKKMKITDRMKNLPIETYNRIIAQNRAKWYPRWFERMAEIGKPTENPNELDLTDPYIHIEWLLCDLNNLHYAKSKKEKDRAKWYAQLTSEELDVYTREYEAGICKGKSLSQEMKEELKRQKSEGSGNKD